MKKILLLIGVLLFIGCSSKQTDVKITEIIPKTEQTSYKVKLEPYKIKITPIVGSKQNDSKVIVDQGVVMKVWIAPYKVKTTLIAGHDIYTWVRKPQFLVGESMPKYNSQQNTLFQVDNKPSFVFRGNYIDNSKPINNQQVKKYVNNIYAIKAGDKDIIKNKNYKINKFDNEILKYLKNKK